MKHKQLVGATFRIRNKRGQKWSWFYVATILALKGDKMCGNKRQAYPIKAPDLVANPQTCILAFSSDSVANTEDYRAPRLFTRQHANFLAHLSWCALLHSRADPSNQM